MNTLQGEDASNPHGMAGGGNKTKESRRLSRYEKPRKLPEKMETPGEKKGFSHKANNVAVGKDLKNAGGLGGRGRRGSSGATKSERKSPSRSKRRETSHKEKEHNLVANTKKNA